MISFSKARFVASSYDEYYGITCERLSWPYSSKEKIKIKIIKMKKH